MNTLLIFFALPIATIILSIVLEKILRCPILTAATFAVFNASALVFVIIYTILAYITALIAEFFFSRCRKRECNNNCCEENNRNNTNNLSNEDAQNIACRVARILNNSNNNCGCNSNSNNEIATINVRDTNGCKTTWCCRRR